jgi:hypothetical protein
VHFNHPPLVDARCGVTPAPITRFQRAIAASVRFVSVSAGQILTPFDDQSRLSAFAPEQSMSLRSSAM